MAGYEREAPGMQASARGAAVGLVALARFDISCSCPSLCEDGQHEILVIVTELLGDRCEGPGKIAHFFLCNMSRTFFAR